MYLWLCHTCEERSIVDGFDAAQTWFTDHLEDGHDPEFRKLEAEEVGEYPPPDDGTRSKSGGNAG